MKFDNKDNIQLGQLGEDDIASISIAWVHSKDRLQYLFRGEWKNVEHNQNLIVEEYYRVLAKPYNLTDALNYIEKNSYGIETQHFSGDFIEKAFAVKALKDLAAGLGDNSNKVVAL